MLSPRLVAVAGLVPEGSVVADVGAGHGRLALHLAASGRCPRVVVIERSREELAAAARFAGGDPRAGRLEFRLGDGLRGLTPEDGVHVAVIAGLGGASIARIVASRPSGLGLSRLVLQPQTEAARLRARLAAEGLGLVAERLVEEDGRYYAVMAAEPGGPARSAPPPGLTEEDVLAAGPCLLRDRPEALAVAWSRQRERLAAIGHPRAEGALAAAERILRYLATSGRGG